VPPTEDGGTVESGGNSGVSPDGALEVSLPAATVALRRHSTADVAVKITRRDIQGDVTLSLSSPAPGVSAPALTIAAGETTGVLRVTSTTDAPLGHASLSLSATLATSKASAAFDVDVSAGSGDLDEAYGSGGKAELALGGTAYGGEATMQKDGKVVFVAYVNPGTATRSTRLVRIDANGKPDLGFPSAIPNLANGQLEGLATGPNDTLVFVGNFGGAASRPYVGRLTGSGALDTTFGGGIVTITVSQTLSSQAGYGMAIQPDGGVLVSTDAHQSSNTADPVFRYTTAGTLDVNFGVGGRVQVSKDGPAYPFVGPDGKILLLSPSSLSPPAPVIARTTAAGVLDPAFGTAGIVTGRAAKRAAVLSNGGAYLWTRNELARIGATGAPDSAFKTWVAPASTTINGVLVLEDGTLWIGATTSTGTGTLTYTEHLFALDASGQPVQQFGKDGHITPPFPANWLMRTPDGKVLVGAVWNGKVSTARLVP